jgi:hypothetical protein
MPEQEAVRVVLSIGVLSHHCARVVDPSGTGINRAGHVEPSEGVSWLGLNQSRQSKKDDQSHEIAEQLLHR